MQTISMPAPARWLPGEVYSCAAGIKPLLATWERHDHPSQVRMRAYLQDLSERLGLERIPEGEPFYLDLEVDVEETSRLLRHYDLENYLTPLVTHLGWRRFFMAHATKRVGGGSRIRIGRATPSHIPLAGWRQAVLDASGSPYRKDWKSDLRASLTATCVSQLPPGPVEVQLAWRCSAERNWVALWKPTGDAMGPILGEPDSKNVYNVADDRIVALSLHREIDQGIGYGIHVGLAWRVAGET